MRYFFSTGEASGELTAVALAEAIARLDPQARLEGIGSSRMRAAGFSLRYDNAGWASMGPLAALPRIPKLLFICLRTALELAASKPDLVVLVDFGAFNVRFAGFLHAIGYRGPMLYLLPPGAWFDNPRLARAVARHARPLTAFAHQRDFYRSLDLEIAYFGHPLVSLVAPRPARTAPPPDGGTVALLPGSRRGEIARHLPRLVAAAQFVRERRPRAAFVVSAADSAAEAFLRERLGGTPLADATILRGAAPALDAADAAWIASGTAVLEAALREVPCVALYVVGPLQALISQRIRRMRYVTLPNLLLEREAVPERLQTAATPRALADALLPMLDDPAPAIEALRAVRTTLGNPDALDRCARFALEVARA